MRPRGDPLGLGDEGTRPPYGIFFRMGGPG